MDAQTTDTVDRQRPFKIFISLLDKWEIGGPLTEVLVLDAFAALRTSLRPGDDHDEVCCFVPLFFWKCTILKLMVLREIQLLMTGNMLFEIIDPFLMWKQIYGSVQTFVENDEPVSNGGELLDGGPEVRFGFSLFVLAILCCRCQRLKTLLRV